MQVARGITNYIVIFSVDRCQFKINCEAGLASRSRGSRGFSWESESKNYACQSRESESEQKKKRSRSCSRTKKIPEIQGRIDFTTTRQPCCEVLEYMIWILERSELKANFSYSSPQNNSKLLFVLS